MRRKGQPAGVDLVVPDDASQPVRRPRDQRIRLRVRWAVLVIEFKAAPPRWRQLAVATAAIVTVLAALGALYDFTGEPVQFRLRGEIEEGFYVPVLASWALLLTAGLAAGVRALWGITRIERLAWLGVGLLFVVMAFDELLMIHERAEQHTGIDWQLLYLPVFAAGGIAWLALLMPMRRWSLEQVMWIGAAALWFVSQILEKFEFTANDVEVGAYKLLDGIEKVCQLTGSSLFMLVATLGVARVYFSGTRARESRRARRPRPAAAP